MNLLIYHMRGFLLFDLVDIDNESNKDNEEIYSLPD